MMAHSEASAVMAGAAEERVEVVRVVVQEAVVVAMASVRAARMVAVLVEAPALALAIAVGRRLPKPVSREPRTFQVPWQASM